MGSSRVRFRNTTVKHASLGIVSILLVVSTSLGRSLQKMYEVLRSSIPKALTSGRLRTLFHLLFTRSVDPDLGVEGGWGRNLVDKAF
jgi:hypothetical protein